VVPPDLKNSKTGQEPLSRAASELSNDLPSYSTEHGRKERPAPTKLSRDFFPCLASA